VSPPCKPYRHESTFSLLMTYYRISGGMCMLSVGELTVRRISKFEITAKASARGTKFNFKLTSRIQVSYDHRYLAPALPHSVYMSSYLQLLLIALSMYNTAVSAKSLQDRLGLPLLNQVVGWTIFGVSQPHPPRMLLRMRSSTQDSPHFPPFSSRLRGRPKGAYSPIFSPSARASSSSPSALKAFSTCRIV